MQPLMIDKQDIASLCVSTAAGLKWFKDVRQSHVLMSIQTVYTHMHDHVVYTWAVSKTSKDVCLLSWTFNYISIAARDEPVEFQNIRKGSGHFFTCLVCHHSDFACLSVWFQICTVHTSIVSSSFFWGFPYMGVPLNHPYIYIHNKFSLNHPAIGVPPLYGNPHMRSSRQVKMKPRSNCRRKSLHPRPLGLRRGATPRAAAGTRGAAGTDESGMGMEAVRTAMGTNRLVIHMYIYICVCLIMINALDSD